MKTKAAVVFQAGAPWEVVELTVDPPRRGEVLVRFVASGLCHSDEHIRSGELGPRLPIVGGHEGAGVVESVGEGVRDLEAGDHVICSPRPACGRCEYCIEGRSNLCVETAGLLKGSQLDGTFRFHYEGQDVGANCMLGTFSELAVIPEVSCIKVPKDLSLDKLAMLGCAVPTGFGAAVHRAQVRPGDTVLIVGAGGVGVNAVQGARVAGATEIVVVDPVESKRTLALELGATRAAADIAGASEYFDAQGRGGADKAIVTVGVSGLAEQAFKQLRKGGTLVLSALGDPERLRLDLSIVEVVRANMTVLGSAMGSGVPRIDLPKLVSLYRQGTLRLDEQVSADYSLDEINEGYENMHSGKNLRGMIRF